MDFTIVTPSYQYGHHIGECLRSVAEQEDVTLEHLVMDAGSTDATAAVVAGFPHATFFQEPDKGMSDGINKGFRRAIGDWVMWLNADDRLKPGALRAVKKFAEQRTNADVIYGGWDFINADGGFQRHMTLFPFDLRMLLYYGCYIGSTACFYRRATTIDRGHFLNPDFHYCMDGEYYARLACEGKRFAYLPEILAEFRLHVGSISQRNLNAKDIDGILRHQRQLAEPAAIRRTYGATPFKHEHLNAVFDALAHAFYRGKKVVMKTVHKQRQEPS